MSHFKTSRVRTMTDVEAAWIGALIEGEGSIWTVHSSRNQWPAVCASNTDPEVLSALLRVTGVGSVSVQWPEGNPLSKKIRFMWAVQARAEAADVIRQCAPYSMKLQEAARAS